jgi:polyphosphate kinase 2 (PPK2 family)
VARHRQEEQKHRLAARRDNPLKALKVSDMDAVALKKWDAYSAARDTMLERTHTPLAPWFCVRADNKKHARKAIIRHLLQRLAPTEIARDYEPADPDILFAFDPAAIEDGRLAR